MSDPPVDTGAPGGLSRLCWRRATCALIVGICFAIPQWSGAQQPDLPLLVREAIADFEPVTDPQVARARDELTNRAAEVDRWLVPGSRKSSGWKKYLGWERLAAHAAAEGPLDPTELEELYTSLNSNQPGLEQERFRTLASALRRYIDLAALASNRDQERYHSAQLAGLARAMELYQEDPRPRLEHVIGTRLEYLASLKRHVTLVAAIRRQYGRTNTFLSLSDRLLSELASDSILEPGTVHDCILGTTIRGTSCTTGQVSVRPIPATDRALLEFSAVGNVAARARGYNSPVVISSTSNTQFQVSQQVELTDDVFRVLPAAAEANTRSRIHSVQSQRRGPLSGVISRVGTKKAHESKRRAEAIASDHAERDIQAKFGETVLEEVTSARRRYRDEFRYPLIRQGEYPEQIAFRSTRDSVSVDVTYANRRQLAAPVAPPEVPAGNDLISRVHQTAVSNYLAMVLGGATLAQTSADEDPQLDRSLPDWLERVLDDAPDDESESVAEDEAEREQAFQPWSVTFRPSRPATLGFDGNEIMVIVHMERFNHGREEFRNWDLMVYFDMEPHQGGLLLVRRKDIEFLPTGFDPKINQGLSPRDIGIRRNLARAVNDLSARGEGVPDRVEVPPLKLSGELSRIGPLPIQHAASENGWLTLGWVLP